MSDVSIYVLTHKEFEPPKDKIYHPLSVFVDEGDNIADKNCYYSELTGCYWIWKNDRSDIVGTAHYRRYLLDENGHLLNEDNIRRILSNHDLITTKILTLNFPYEYGFSKNHKPYYLKELENLLKEKFPDVYPIYKESVRDVHTYFGNMLIAKKEIFDDYHKWLFEILFSLESRIIIDEPDSYHRRIFGFISEFLLYVYVKYKNLIPFHTMVGMTGEKTEVASIKEKIGDYFKVGDFKGAKEFFMAEYKIRPDILMEASDIGWKLHMCMEAISICEFEADENIEPFIYRISEFDDIMVFLKRLNQYAITGEFDEDFLRQYRVSEPAIQIALKLANAAKYGTIKRDNHQI